MAPTPALTNILYVDYEGAFGARSFQLRFNDATTSTAAVAAAENFLGSAFVNAWKVGTAVTGMRWRAKGTTFSLPVPFTGPIQGTQGGTLPIPEYPRFLSLSARGQLSGAELRLFVYGFSFTTPGDYRFTGTEDTGVAGLISAWAVLLTSDGVVTEQGDNALFRPYANVGYNSYYERRARTGS